MNIYLEALLRTLLSILVLLILARLTGAHQISQLTFYDYIVGISAGSIAASMCIEEDISIWIGLIGITLFMLSSLFFSFITSKSITLRRLITGSPVFLIAKGEILYKGLKRAHFDTNDMLRELRSQGYFDITEINYAILETNGNVSVMPKAYARPATVKDMALKVQEDSIKADVVIDGKILKGNLKAFGKTRTWLLEELGKQGVRDTRQVLLATLDDQGALNVYYKETQDMNSRTVLQ